MNIFEKIKQFFKNFGKKQKLIDSPKGKLEEMGDLENIGESTTTVEKPEQTTFKDQLRFDPEDLLDPRVCQGDNVIPNILKTLGVNEAILQNPAIIRRILYSCEQIIEQNNFRLPKGDKPLERKDIEAIVDMFKSSVALTDSAARTDKLNEMGIGRTGKRMRFIGMTIEPETGNLIISSDSLSGETPDKPLYEVFEFSTDDKGNVVERAQSALLNPNGTSELIRREYDTTYDEDGIAMQREHRLYDKGVLLDHHIVTRDSENPFITQTHFFVSAGHSREEVKYTVNVSSSISSSIDPRDLLALFPARNFPNSGSRSFRVFDDRESCVGYYTNQRYQILNSIYSIGWLKHLSNKEKEILENKLKKLAQKAGLLPKEQEAEKSE